MKLDASLSNVLGGVWHGFMGGGTSSSSRGSISLLEALNGSGVSDSGMLPGQVISK